MKTVTKQQAKNLRSNFNLLLEFILIVAVISIVSVLVFEVNDDAREDIVASHKGPSCGLNATGGTGGTILYTNCSIAYNATIKSDQAVAKVPDRLPLLGTAVIFGVVIYVIMRVIPFRIGGSGMTSGSFQ